MFARVDERRGGEHVATADVRQVWTNVRTCRRTVDRMTHHTRRRQENLLSTFLQIGHRGNRCLDLIPTPGVELFRRIGDDPERHARMLQSAVLRTLTAIDAGLVS